MQTETRQMAEVLPNPADPDHPHLLIVHHGEGQRTVLELRPGDLAAIAQQAYDQHGIVAQVWTAAPVPAEWHEASVQGPAVSETSHLRRMLETGA